MKQQTQQVCLAAVQQDGRALEYVKAQHPSIRLAAVQWTRYNCTLGMRAG